MRQRPDIVKRGKRVDVRLPATLVDSSGVSFAVTVLDLSSEGFRVEISEDHFRVGEHVLFRTERSSDVFAELRWVIGREAGGVFRQATTLT